MLTLSSTSAEETRQIGTRLAESLPRPLIVLLRGDYGSGKTTLVQGLAAGLGVRGAVRSPSYNIVKLYEGDAGSLVHVDLYRAHGPAEIGELGIWEFVGEDTVVAIEWPGELAPSTLEYYLLTIQIEVQSGADNVEEPDGSPRLLELNAAGFELRECAEALDAFTAR